MQQWTDDPTACIMRRSLSIYNIFAPGGLQTLVVAMGIDENVGVSVEIDPTGEVWGAWSWSKEEDSHWVVDAFSGEMS